MHLPSIMRAENFAKLSYDCDLPIELQDVWQLQKEINPWLDVRKATQSTQHHTQHDA